MPRSSKGILIKIWLNEGSAARGIRTPYKRSPGFSTWHSAELGEAKRPHEQAFSLLVDGLIGLVSWRGAPWGKPTVKVLKLFIRVLPKTLRDGKGNTKYLGQKVIYSKSVAPKLRKVLGTGKKSKALANPPI